MVVRDSNEFILAKQNELEDSSDFKQLIAQPSERFAASVIDYLILLLPIVYLVLAPFQKASKLAVLMDNDLNLNISILLGVAAVVIVILGFQVMSTWLWGATPGQLFMGLRVVSIWPHRKLGLVQIVYRAVCWLLSTLLIGIPFLSIFSNVMRRPFHDRLADTIVVTVKKNQVAVAPSVREISIVRSAYALIGIFILTSVMSGAIATFVSWEKQTQLISSLEDEDKLCPEISDAQSKWPNPDEQEISRLEIALVLFSASAIDVSCLEAEVEYLHADAKPSAMLSLVKSFVYSDYQSLSDEYLLQACELESKSSVCEMSQIISASSLSGAKEVEMRLDLLGQNTPAYLSIWAIKKYMLFGQYDKAEVHVNKLPYLSELNDFVLPYKAKLLWHQNNKKASEEIALVAYSATSDEVKLELSSFMCFEQIWNHCERKDNLSCKEFESLTSSNTELSQLQTSLVYLQKWECENTPLSSGKYESLLSLNLHTDIKQLIIALSEDGTDGFNELLDDEAVQSELRLEATRRLVQRTKSKGLLKVVTDEWMKSEPNLAWAKVGETLFEKFYAMNDYIETVKIFDFLKKNVKTILDQKLQQKAVIAAVESGQYDRGREYFFDYASYFPRAVSSAGRALASKDKFSQAVQALEVVK